MKYLLSADFHFNHTNCINFEPNRKKRFGTIEKYNDAIIKQCNEQAKKNDVLYHVGDFCFKESQYKDEHGKTVGYKYWLDKINCSRVVLISGNHDNSNSVNCQCDSLIKNFVGYKINMVHRPCDMIDNVDFNIVGHVHSRAKFICFENKKGINVGIDAWDFKLVSLNAIVELFRKTDWDRVKHNTMM